MLAIFHNFRLYILDCYWLFQVSLLVGVPRSFPVRPTKVCVRWPVLEPGIPVVCPSPLPGLDRRATIIVLKSTRRSTVLGTRKIRLMLPPSLIPLIRTLPPWLVIQCVYVFRPLLHAMTNVTILVCREGFLTMGQSRMTLWCWRAVWLVPRGEWLLWGR